MLQRKAAMVMIASLIVFHLGIAGVLYRLYNFFTPAVRRAFLESPEVRETLWVAGVWIVGLLLLACLFVLRLIERQVTKPVAELARLCETVASGAPCAPLAPS